MDAPNKTTRCYSGKVEIPYNIEYFYTFENGGMCGEAKVTFFPSVASVSSIQLTSTL